MADRLTIDVTINGDDIVELDENFFVNLSSILAGGRDVTFADNQGEGTIENDDQASISIDDVSVVEGDVGTTNAVFTVTLNSTVDAAVTVDFITNDNTAEDENGDNDYQSNVGQVTFPAGSLAGAMQMIGIEEDR